MKNTLDSIDPSTLENTTGGTTIIDDLKDQAKKVGRTITDWLQPRRPNNPPQQPCIVCGRG